MFLRYKSIFYDRYKNKTVVMFVFFDRWIELGSNQDLKYGFLFFGYLSYISR